ncbi:MAG: hypothetical protein JWQ95_945, partial [Sphaerisporangium sp.]|nr:hypothetical protein [Sphaerisporangium sp.]
HLSRTAIAHSRDSGTPSSWRWGVKAGSSRPRATHEGAQMRPLARRRRRPCPATCPRLCCTGPAPRSYRGAGRRRSPFTATRSAQSAASTSWLAPRVESEEGGEVPQRVQQGFRVVIRAPAARSARRLVPAPDASSCGPGAQEHPADLLMRHPGRRADPAQPPPLIPRVRHRRGHRRGCDVLQHHAKLREPTQPYRGRQPRDLATDPLHIGPQERHAFGIRHAARLAWSHPKCQRM